MSGERPVIEHRVRANGLTFSVFEWPGDGGRPVFLAHASSFHARCWDQVVERLPGVTCIAIDMRGHGRSDRPPPPYPWLAFGEDVAAVTKEMGIRDALGVGHSKGGHAVINGAFLNPGSFAGLLLLDPVVVRRERYSLPPPSADNVYARRRNEWTSWEEMYERFAARHPFSLWDPVVLRDYCEFGLLPRDGSEGFELACPPWVEALLYSGGAGEADPYPAIHSLDLPVHIVRARLLEPGEDAPPMSTSTCVPDLASHFRNATDLYVPQYGHFIPMQAPGFAASQAQAMLDRLGESSTRAV